VLIFRGLRQGSHIKFASGGGESLATTEDFIGSGFELHHTSRSRSNSIVLGNVQISYEGFLSNFIPPYDGILTVSANPLFQYDVSTNPLPKKYRKQSKINCKLSFF